MDSRYIIFSLEVILTGDAEQNNPLIRYELPYTFDVVAKLPRTKNHDPASNEETTDGWDAVIDRINPSRGPTTGGPEVWILSSNFPTGASPLYARFGDGFARAVGLLSLLLEDI